MSFYHVLLLHITIQSMIHALLDTVCLQCSLHDTLDQVLAELGSTMFQNLAEQVHEGTCLSLICRQA